MSNGRPPYDVNDFAKGETPAFPLSKQGSVMTKGWDIPWCWAVDANGLPYADYGAHGCSMTLTTFDELIKSLESDDELIGAAGIRKLAGKKRRLPPWMNDALNAGWTPPSSWHRDDYE